MPITSDLLKRSWQRLLAEQPGLRMREAACELGVSELELLAVRDDLHAVRLAGPWPDLLREFPGLGRVMCITRNDAGAHERFGTFEQVAFYDGIGVVLGSEIDLRLFMAHWRHGYAVTESTRGGIRHSFRFFDAYGVAIHQVTLQEREREPVFMELRERFRAADPAPPAVAPLPPSPVDPPDETIDIAGFRAAWLALEDTAYFADLLQRFGLRREHGLRLAPPGHAWRTPVERLRRVLESVRATRSRVMIFLRSPGCLQIHTGTIRKLRMFGPRRLNILDPEFNLHLNLSLIHSLWVVRKPTLDGMITSLELFDVEGNNLALLFGKRGYGQPEDPNWRDLLLRNPV